MNVFKPVAVTSSWLDVILNAEGYPDQLLPMEPLARSKLSRTTVIGKLLEVVGEGEGVNVFVGNGVLLGWVGVNVPVAVAVDVTLGMAVLIGVLVGDGVNVAVGVDVLGTQVDSAVAVFVAVGVEV